MYTRFLVKIRKDSERDNSRIASKYSKPIVSFCAKEHALVVDTFGSVVLGLVLYLRKSLEFDIIFAEFFLTFLLNDTHFGAQKAVA